MTSTLTRGTRTFVVGVVRKLGIVAGALALAACSVPAGATPSPAPPSSDPPPQAASAPATPFEFVCPGVPHMATGQQTSEKQTALCRSGPLGVLPASDKTPSIRLLQPGNGDVLSLGEPFEVAVAFRNFEPGLFDDPGTLYGLRPFSVNEEGHAQGHSHVYVQRLSENEAPNASEEVDAFLALNFADVNGDTRLDRGDEGADDFDVMVNTESITEAGTYRVCVDVAGGNHLAFPKGVARNGPQIDCIQVEFI